MANRVIKQTAADLLEHDFAQERASALGRLGRRLEAALAALSAFDAENPREAQSSEQRRIRASLATEASIALWYFVVQREACGLRDLRYVLRDYRIPPEVAATMGAVPAAPVMPGKRLRR